MQLLLRSLMMSVIIEVQVNLLITLKIRLKNSNEYPSFSEMVESLLNGP